MLVLWQSLSVSARTRPGHSQGPGDSQASWVPGDATVDPVLDGDSLLLPVASSRGISRGLMVISAHVWSVDGIFSPLRCHEGYSSVARSGRWEHQRGAMRSERH